MYQTDKKVLKSSLIHAYFINLVIVLKHFEKTYPI